MKRRDCLAALGLTPMFLESLAHAGARSSRPSAGSRARGPSRLLVYFITQGAHLPHWQMRPDGQPDDRHWQFSLAATAEEQFSPCLQPLYPVRDQVLALDGLALGSTGAYGTNEHYTGHAVALSGARPSFEGQYVTGLAGPSLDHLIAGAHADPGPIRALHYGSTFQAVSYDLDGRAIPSQTDAPSAFARLFPGSAQGDDPRTTLAGRRSILDFVAERARQISGQLSAEDRKKLDAHHSMIRDLERQLQGLESTDCGSVVPPTKEPSDPLEWIGWQGRTWMDMAVLALRCGLSRVATVYDPGPSTPYLGFDGGDLHTDFAHSATFLPESAEVMTAHHRYYTEALRRLIERMASLPDGDASMLDDTLIVVANELGQPGHEWHRYPVLLAGAGRHLELGRYVHWPASHVMKGPFTEHPVGPLHNRFLLAIAHLFGLDIEHMGDASLPAADGSSIPATGALEGLWTSR